MIDREARNQFIVLLKQFYTGKITNFAYEDAIPETEDDAVFAIHNNVIWPLYSDFKKQKIRKATQNTWLLREDIKRSILLLQSDEPYKFILSPSWLSKIFLRLKGETDRSSQYDTLYFPFCSYEHLQHTAKAKERLGTK
ncbi:hypothetical protein [Fretibacter rubidus]|uniref:hypothetical protein n=1 Tax=Fretibacter rubidus TaxID=570162 RepID=UPI00352AEC95